MEMRLELLVLALCLTFGAGFLLPEENIVVPGRSASRMSNSRAGELAKLLKELRARKDKRNRLNTELEELGSFSECRLDHHERLACGDQEVSEKSCVRRGCCWRETAQPGAPWCFHSARSSHGACAVEDGSRMACGLFGGGGAGLCKKAGCCWRPSLGENVPWCFLPQSRSGSLDIRDLFRTR